MLIHIICIFLYLICFIGAINSVNALCTNYWRDWTNLYLFPLFSDALEAWGSWCVLHLKQGRRGVWKNVCVRAHTQTHTPRGGGSHLAVCLCSSHLDSEHLNISKMWILKHGFWVLRCFKKKNIYKIYIYYCNILVNVTKSTSVCSGSCCGSYIYIRRKPISEQYMVG